MKKNLPIILVVVIAIVLVIVFNTTSSIDSMKKYFDNDFYLLSSPDNKEFMSELEEYADDNHIDLQVTYADDLETVELLKEENIYDAIWMSNSVWSFLLSDVSIEKSKSININPVVFGIKKSKATELGFTSKDVYNKDIVNAIKGGNLKYVMSSVTKTNTGLIAYLGFLNALSGSPEILTSEMINKPSIVNDLKMLFSGVERVSGNDDFLQEMFLNDSSYEAVLATESSLIDINKKLVKDNKEPLYLIYPVDGVAINDSPFAYINHKQEKEDKFDLLQSFLLSKSSQSALEKLGKRTWYGGIKVGADVSSFKKEWGINTEEYLIPLKYPSQEVMNEAILLYINNIRKPSVVAFCLDFSGSMYGNGEQELKSAMEYILDYEQSSVERIQFSEHDKIYVLPFSDNVLDTYVTFNGKDTANMIEDINSLSPSGSTNLYGCAAEALNLVNESSDEFSKTIILMTDGKSNVGSYNILSTAYNSSLDNKSIPIYSIMFGNSDRSELTDIARLSNAKVFDGRNDLLKAFREVRSYN